MDEKQSSLQEIINSFNSAEPVSEDFFRKVEGENGKAYFEELERTGKLPAKIYEVKKLIGKVESSINGRLEKANIGLKKINLLSNTSISADSKAPKLMTKINIVKNGQKSSESVNFALNLSAQKLLKLPAEEIYAVVSALVYTSLLKKKEGSLTASENEIEEEVLFVSDAYQEEEIKNRNKSNEQDAGSKSIIIKYIKKFLKDFFGLFDDPKAIEYNAAMPANFYDKISQAVANDLAGKNGTEAVASMFNLEALSKEVLSENDVAVARTGKLREQAEYAAQEGNEELFTSYSQQSLELMSYQTKEDFTKMKFGGAAEQSGMAAFTQSFISEILAKNGLSTNAVVVTFAPNEYPGVFNPPNKINVDASKIENITDFVMTLAHETQHAVDHVKKGVNGSKNRSNGAPFNWSEVANSGLDRKSEEYKFLNNLNAMCYHLDPDEREGRLAEVYALKFMGQNASGNHALKNEIGRNIDAFNAYQEKTVRMGEQLMNPEHPGNIDALRQKFESMRGSLSSSVERMMDERLTYLEELCEKFREEEREKGVDVFSAERKSVKQAENVNRVMKGLQEAEIEQSGPAL